MAGQSMTKPRGDKTQRYVFYLGVVLAAVAAIAVFVVISGADSGGGGGGDVPNVVANEAIPKDTVITPDMLKLEYMSPDKAVDNAFDSRSALVDRVATEDIEAGKTIVRSMVTDVAGPDSLSIKVQEGMRAVSVDVQEVVIGGGNARPGDHVDVVTIFEVTSVEAANSILQVLGIDHTFVEPPVPANPAPAGGEEAGVEDERFALTVTMLQDVKLLAIAQTLTETSAGGNVAEEAEQADTEPRAATATLELPPQKSQEITTASHFGVLRMVVRRVGDDEKVDVVPTLLAIERTR